MNTEDHDTSGPAQPRLIDIVQAELVDGVAVSKALREKIETAKTTAKKRYYLKKLKKNNIHVMQMLQAADRLKRREESTATEDQNTDD